VPPLPLCSLVGELARAVPDQIQRGKKEFDAGLRNRRAG
jgi:hypothetical protein